MYCGIYPIHAGIVSFKVGDGGGVVYSWIDALTRGHSFCLHWKRALYVAAPTVNLEVIFGTITMPVITQWSGLRKPMYR